MGQLTIELIVSPLHSEISVISREDDLNRVGGPTPDGFSLTSADMQRISRNTEELIKYAKEAAGLASSDRENVYIDGLPSRSLPPADLISRVVVNPDSFSAEYADGNQPHIEIITKAPDRHVHFDLGTNSLGGASSNALAPALHSDSKEANFSLSGPIPTLPFTLLLRGDLARNSDEEPVLATFVTSQSDADLQPAVSATDRDSMSFFASYSHDQGTRVSFAYDVTGWNTSNVGVGGLSLVETGRDLSFMAHETRVTLVKEGAGFLYQAGLDFSRTNSDSRANTSSLGVVAVGSFVGGGAAITVDRQRRRDLTAKNVIRFGKAKHLWTGGLTIGRSSDSDFEQPNPAGVVWVDNLNGYLNALAGKPTATWFLLRGNGQVAHATTTVAPFIDSQVFSNQKANLTVGLRADYQTSDGFLFSPRFSSATKAGGFIFRAGAGMFAHTWGNDLFLHVLQYDGSQFQQIIKHNVALADVTTLPLGSSSTITSQLASDLVRPRDWVAKASTQRPLGKLIPSLEYTWTAGLHMLGSRRVPSGSDWIDLLQSDRSLRRHEVHASMRYGWKMQSITAHYRWIRSFDNTDGPFSFLEREDDLRGEWARSSGVSPHNFSLLGNFSLPSAISLTLVETVRGSAPYSITSGQDLIGNGLFNDRGGRSRNSGKGPSYNSLSLYAYRRVALPIFPKSKNIHMNVGLQADNLLGHRNYLTFDSVSSSPLFGQPIAALPGRTFRVWFNFD